MNVSASLTTIKIKQLLNGWSLFTVITALIIASPVFIVVAYVFVPSGEVWTHLANTVLPNYISNSVILLIGVGLGTLIVGTGCAWLVTMCEFPGRKIFEWALLLPLAVPAYVIAYTYTGLLDYAGPVQEFLRELFGWRSARDYWFPEIRTLWGATTMFTLVLYPYVYMLSRAAFLEQSICVLEVSRTLGRTPWQSFKDVAFPLARPAIAAGTALALMETLNDFGTVHFFAVDTFTTGIYRTWFGMGEPAAAAQLGACMLIFIVSLIALERYSRGQAAYHHTTVRYRALRKLQINGIKQILCLIACILPVFLGFVLPAGILLNWTFATTEWWMTLQFWEFAFNSFILATVAALLAVVLAVLMAYGARLQPSLFTKIGVRAASIGYAVPGSVLAVGIMLPFAWTDNLIDSWAREYLGFSTGLILSGTIVAVVFAYVVRFLSVSYNAIEAGLGKVTKNMDCAARTLGHGPGETLRKVHLPLIRASMFSAGILVFVDVMKELPATMIMRPFNFTTLAVRTFELASDEQLAEASSAALAIVLVGIIPVIMISRTIAKSRPGHES
ncbi:MAG: iron ABC transporter permease [Methylocystaceae bacterium]|nr:iron ABC transporter permease [Methylocystaceae bacterium]